MTTPPLLRILQALLLAAREPLSLERLASAFSEAERPSRADLRRALEQLQQEASIYPGSQELIELASGWRYQIKTEFAPWIGRLWDEKPPRYSRALLETLALIAYRQPVTRGEIEDVRGVSVSSQIIRTLEEREWIRAVGHREVPGRPALYATTRHFLDYFNLKSLNELPPLDALRQTAEASAQEWEDALDRSPRSPQLELPVTNTTEDGLTFADLAERFKKPDKRNDK